MQEKMPESLNFFQVMGDVKPLDQDTVVTHSPHLSLQKKSKLVQLQEGNQNNVPLSMDGVTPVNPDDYLEYKQAGIQDGVYKNLRLGKYTIDNKIVISSKTTQEAAFALYTGLMKSHLKGHRVVLVQHGKGMESRPFPAYKKSMLRHWLLQIDQVIAFHTAINIHGGLGATYVLLKKHANQKEINRELNRRR